MNKDKGENIYDVKNYFKRIYLKSASNYITKYIDLINEYVVHASENIKISNIDLYLFVFERGIDTLSHIFIILLMYTRNLDLTYHHCNKAYLYYIEFISQIGEDNNSFLQLNSKDATLFVYKKTIFDINTNVRESFNQTKSETICINTVKQSIDIYNLLIKFSINHIDNIEFKNDKKIVILIEKETTKIINKILENNCFLNERICNFFLDFLYQIDNKKINFKKKMNIIYIYLKRIINNNISDSIINNIKKKLLEKDIDTIFEDLTALKIVNFLFDCNS